MSVRPPSLASMKALKKPDKVPPGWFTRSALEKEWGLCQAQTVVLIKQAMDAGKAEVKKFSIPHALRSPTPTPHYRFK